MAKIFKVNLTELTKKYFIEAISAFKAKGAEVVLDNTTDPANPVLKVSKKWSKYRNTSSKRLCHI